MMTNRSLRSLGCLLLFFQLSVFVLIREVSAQNRTPDAANRASAAPSSSADAAIERFVKECVQIIPGEDRFSAKFSVGSRDAAEFELSLRAVELVDSFRISKYETTQELYQAVSGQNPSRWKGPRNSVENVSMTEAEVFCRELTARLHKGELIAKREFVRLPTSLEWEYCCRAGSPDRYCFGEQPGEDGGTETLDEYGWHTGNAAGNDPAVGILKPNSWGLYDVHGYLSEFVSDGVPATAEVGKQRVVRGGSWKDRHPRLSSSAYLVIPAETRDDAIGFRCLIADKPLTKKPPRQ